MDKNLFASLLGRQVTLPEVAASARPQELAGSFLKEVAGGDYSDVEKPGFIQSMFESFQENGSFLSSFAKGSGT